MNPTASFSMTDLYNRLPLEKQSEVINFIKFLLSKPTPQAHPLSMPPPVDVGFSLSEEWLEQAKAEGCQ